MEAFCELFRRLDETNKTNEKLAAMQAYFQQADAGSAAWAVHVLTGRRLKRLVKHADLTRWGAEFAGIPEWLFEICYDQVGDAAETIALVSGQVNDEIQSPTLAQSDTQSHYVNTVTLENWFYDRLLALDGMSAETQREIIYKSWRELDSWGRFVFNKLITGGLRIGVSQKSVVKALSLAFGLEPNIIAHRLMGNWQPSARWFESLISDQTQEAEFTQPYPFCLANPLQQPPESLGDVSDWQAEWKWDGIRAQIIRRGNEFTIWSRGEDLLTDRFPELDDAISRLPAGTVIDGELVAWRDDKVLPFAELQRRIGRKQLGPKILRDVPIRFLAFDLLEWQEEDIRARPLSERTTLLRSLLDDQTQSVLLLPEQFAYQSWKDLEVVREQSRELGVEGLMLKRKDGPYEVGRVTGNWWKWKIDPYTIDAVLIYAQTGSGRRASLYTDYTFALWEGEELVPFAKAYSGLTDEEIKQVDRFIRENTQEKFGPVRSVKPELVFELAFENVQRSSRHKSGVAVRFPRIHRWRQDKNLRQANTLAELLEMIPEDRREMPVNRRARQNDDRQQWLFAEDELYAAKGEADDAAS